MNLRTVTIWTTGVMLIVTIVIPASLEFLWGGVAAWWLLWLTNSLPLFFSLQIARILQHKVSIGILFFSTIIHGLWYGCGILYAIIWSGMASGILADIGLFAGCLCSLSVLIPTWITAYVIEILYRKKNPNTPAEP